VEAYLKDRFRNAIIPGMGYFGAGTSYGKEEEIVIQDTAVETRPNQADAFYRQGASVVIDRDKHVLLTSAIKPRYV